MLRFGTAGIPISTPKHDIIAGIERVRELGLDALEIEFVQSVNMKEEKARLVRKEAHKFGVSLSVHAPYYINLNSEHEDVVKASMERIYKASRIGHLCGARTIVFHAGFYGKQRENALQVIKGNLHSLRNRLNEEGIHVRLGLETTGRQAQFGTLDELLALTKISGVVPVIDFSHLHARGNGLFRERGEIEKVMDMIRKRRRSLLTNLHMHLSGIAYSEKGERRHINLSESDFPYRELIEMLHERGVAGTIISESPVIEQDALLLKTVYEKLLQSKDS